ncbi:UNVERIFIED_CONTAM: hypothetical protein Sradi_0112100 [Sesamum radiatum]|uniref:Uncharacterized protein n=1 Tax=Sesamum radiatum TaxID=300843 RepID=A0AAW2WJ03_SESRA
MYSCDKIPTSNFALPHSLKKLSLRGCDLAWEDMRIVGSLPNLEVLKLERFAFEGPKWDPTEGEFVRLKFLLINTTDLKYWRAEHTHFPSLEHLVLRFVDLEEIPVGLAEIHTLRVIELKQCKDSVLDSVKQILEEREDMGYEGLQIKVHTRGGAKYY